MIRLDSSRAYLPVRLTLRSFWPLLLLTFCGCGPEELDLGPFGQVTGKVTHEGKPVEKGFITFHCLESGQVASCNLAADGSYAMSLNGKEGLPLGDYKVSIRPPLVADTGTEANSGRRRRNNPTYDPNFTPEIPMQYRFESKSGLTASVVAGENRFDFDLKDSDAVDDQDG